MIKYKFMDVQKVEEKLSNNRTYNIYEFVKPFMDLDTNNFLKLQFQKTTFLFWVTTEIILRIVVTSVSSQKKILLVVPRLFSRHSTQKLEVFLNSGTWFPALRKDRFFVSLLPKENSSNE